MNQSLVILRRYSVAIAKDDFKAMPFNKMPGPKGFLGIGNFYNYMKIFGKYDLDKLHHNGMKMYLKYGPIVCERMIPGVSVVWLYDPKDIAQIFIENPGDYPARRSHIVLKKYRDDRPHIYRTSGLLPTNGEDWWKVRCEVQKGLSAPKNVRNFLPNSDEIVKEFLETLPNHFDANNVVDEMLDELSRLSFEHTIKVVFDKRMNSFSHEEHDSSSRSSKIIEAAHKTNTNTLITDQGIPLWRLFETSASREVCEGQAHLEKCSIDFTSEKINGTHDGHSLLDQYLQNPNLNIKDLHGSALDLLLAGIHTTAYIASFALYHITTNPHVQELMYEEALKALPNADDPITPSVINAEMPYTRAVLKETFRLNPISVGVGRISNRDMILSGYHVPKNTILVSQNMVSCRMEKYFHDPLKFLPERWLKSSDQKQDSINPFLVLPFGHGSRSCVARRLAQQNLLLFLLRLMRNFKVEWRGEPHLEVKTRGINEPASKITLKFDRR